MRQLAPSVEMGRRVSVWHDHDANIRRMPGVPLNDARIANIVFNETRSLSGTGIQQARINIAHTVANSEAGSGNRPRSAPAHAHVPPAEAATYGQCLQAVQEMRRQRTQGTDPTNGARNFNFRRNTSRAAFYKLPIQTQVGPPDNSYPTPDLPDTGIYANTYGN
jgi:hypothetical protein